MKTSRITMPPGTRSVTTDRNPTLRMITSGELKWGSVPVESDKSAELVEWSVAPAPGAAP